MVHGNKKTRWGNGENCTVVVIEAELEAWTLILSRFQVLLSLSRDS